MADIRLILNEPMRRAYGEGRKTQHRKPWKTQPLSMVTNTEVWKDGYWRIEHEKSGDCVGIRAKSPFGVPGDTLLMLEPYRIDGHDFYGGAVWGVYLDGGEQFQTSLTDHEWHKWLNRKYPNRKTSSRFMYNSLVRHRETVKRVWVERVQDISIDDIYAEGCPALASDWDASELYEWFSDMWHSLYAKDGLRWDANPWVWCVDWREQ